jgi:UDPglucose--hexose-1-phosphate uridylyltransferase
MGYLCGLTSGTHLLPPPEYNPLAMCVDPANPTELPAGGYAIAVFENRFPYLSMDAHDRPARWSTLRLERACVKLLYSLPTPKRHSAPYRCRKLSS